MTIIQMSWFKYLRVMVQNSRAWAPESDFPFLGFDSRLRKVVLMSVFRRTPAL